MLSKNGTRVIAQREKKNEQNNMVGTSKKEAVGKNCPFCGSGNNLKIEKSEYDGYGYFVRCGCCMATGSYAVNIEDAISQWNERRTIPKNNTTPKNYTTPF